MNIRLCRSHELKEGQCRGFPHLKPPVFAVRQHGEVYAYINHCPHLGIPLNWQPDAFLDSEGDMIQCATHGALFVIESGECVAGPCAGQYLNKLTVSERDGEIVVNAD